MAVLAGMFVVAVGAILVKAVLLDDSARAVPVDEALDRYRSATTSATGAGSPAPAGPTRSTVPAAVAPPTSRPAPMPLAVPGVYRYRTVGAESIDALGGARHEYPAETTITVTSHGCGVRLSWDPLEERRDEWQLCATPEDVELQPNGLQKHQFFGQDETEEIRCDRAIAVVPATERASEAPLRRSCTLGDDGWLPIWQWVGDGEVELGGESIAVTHVRMTVEDDDEYWEHTTIDWQLAPSGLPFEVTVETSSRSPSPIGGVVYNETYHLELISTTPLQ
jgi:hypothetical protein